MKVSVVIPTYNRADLLVQAVDSVLKQNVSDLEVIVVDDGSTDHTRQAMAPYENRIRYIYQNNGGVNQARNHGLSLSTGEYIALLDNDDLWLPGKLAIQLGLMAQFPQLACLFSNFFIYREGEDPHRDGIATWFHGNQDWSKRFPVSYGADTFNDAVRGHLDRDCRLYIGDIYHASLDQYFVLPSTALIRRSMIPAGQIFAEHDPICGDWEYFARLSRSHPVGYLDLETASNRSHEDAVRLTRTSWKRQLQCRIDMIERLYLKDEDFYRKHRAETDRIYGERLYRLAKQQLLSDERIGAQHTMQRALKRIHHPHSRHFLLAALCRLPLAGKVLHRIRPHNH